MTDKFFYKGILERQGYNVKELRASSEDGLKARVEEFKDGIPGVAEREVIGVSTSRESGSSMSTHKYGCVVVYAERNIGPCLSAGSSNF